MRRLPVAILFILFSCTDKSIQSRASEADGIEIIDGATHFSHIETRQQIVGEFKKAFDRPADTDDDCTAQGTVLFRKGDKKILEVGYYKDATACNVFIVEEKGKKTCYRYSFNVLAYLGEYFQKLKQEHNARHN
jgi:hypothetical protein